MPEEPYPSPGEADPSEQRRPLRRRLLMAFLSVLAGTLLGWWLADRPSPAEEAAQSFVRAAMSGRYRSIAPHLSRETIAGIGDGPNARSIFVHRLQRYLTLGYTSPRRAIFAVGRSESVGDNIQMVEIALENDTDPLLTRIREEMPSFAHTWLVMVHEGGRWKFDVSRTIAGMVISRGYCQGNSCLSD